MDSTLLLPIGLGMIVIGAAAGIGKFAAAAAAPIALNIVLIFSLLLAFNLELNIAKSLSVGVTLSGIIQFFILIFERENISRDL